MLTRDKWEMSERFFDDDYELIKLKKLENVNIGEVKELETHEILHQIEKGEHVMNKTFPVSLSKL